MVLDTSDKIAITALVISVFFATLNYLYARGKTQPQPRIYISKVKVIVPYAERKDKPPSCTFNILFRNSGEISTVLDLIIGINVRPYHIERKKDEVHTLAPQPLTHVTSLHSGQNDPRNFSFDLTENAKDWNEGTLMVTGTYLGYKDRERHILLLFKGKRDEERWKPSIYVIEEDSILGFIKRKLRLLQKWNLNRKYRKLAKKTISTK